MNSKKQLLDLAKKNMREVREYYKEDKKIKINTPANETEFKNIMLQSENIFQKIEDKNQSVLEKNNQLKFSADTNEGFFPKTFKDPRKNKEGYIVLTTTRDAALKKDDDNFEKLYNAPFSEKMMSDLLNSVGLRAPEYEIFTLDLITEKGEKISVPALSTKSFEKMNVLGEQFRKTNTNYESQLKYGHSMIFGEKKNVTPKYIKDNLFKYFIDDLVKLTLLPFDDIGQNTMSIVIKDTKDTPKHSGQKEERLLFSEKNQQLQLYFSDFSNKYYSIIPLRKGEDLVDAHGNFNEESIKGKAKGYARMALCAIESAPLPEEKKSICELYLPNTPSTLLLEKDQEEMLDSIADEIKNRVIAHLRAENFSKLINELTTDLKKEFKNDSKTRWGDLLERALENDYNSNKNQVNNIDIIDNVNISDKKEAFDDLIKNVIAIKNGLESGKIKTYDDAKRELGESLKNVINKSNEQQTFSMFKKSDLSKVLLSFSKNNNIALEAKTPASIPSKKL